MQNINFIHVATFIMALVHARAHGRSCDSFNQLTKKLVTCLVAARFARKGSQKKAHTIESPPSFKHPQTTSTPESCSFIFLAATRKLTSRSNFSPAFSFNTKRLLKFGASTTAGCVSRLITVVFNASLQLEISFYFGSNGFN